MAPNWLGLSHHLALLTLGIESSLCRALADTLCHEKLLCQKLARPQLRARDGGCPK